MQGYKIVDKTKIMLITCLNNNGGNVIKIDIIAYIEDKYSEISCNYYFTDTTRPIGDIFVSLLLDIKKYHGEGKLMKMYKRKYSYRSMKGEDVDDLIALFNTEIGRLNMLAHDVDVLMFIEEKKLDVNVKKLNKMTTAIYRHLPETLKKIKDLKELHDNLTKLVNKMLEES